MARERWGRIEGEYRPARREYVYVARISNPPPMRWGAILGDWAHNLRSALDVLMWQLVVHAGGVPTRRTQFPIFLRRSRCRARAPRMIDGVGRGVRTKVERLQPFHGARKTVPAGARALAMLAWLSNTDKHRFVQPTITGLGIHIDGAGTITGIPNWDAGTVLSEIWCRSTELPHATDVVRFRLAPRGPNPVVRLTHEIHLAIAFGPRSISPWSLDYIRFGVGRVFEVLAPEFDVDQGRCQEPEAIPTASS